MKNKNDNRLKDIFKEVLGACSVGERAIEALQTHPGFYPTSGGAPLPEGFRAFANVNARDGMFASKERHFEKILKISEEVSLRGHKRVERSQMLCSALRTVSWRDNVREGVTEYNIHNNMLIVLYIISCIPVDTLCIQDISWKKHN